MPKRKPAKKKSKPLAEELTQTIGMSGEILGRSSTHWIVRKKNGWVTVKRNKSIDPLYSKVAAKQKAASRIVIERKRGKGGDGTDDGGYNILAGD